MRLVQLVSGEKRAVAVVEEPSLRLLRGFASVYALAVAAIERGERLPALVGANRSDEVLDYDAIYQGKGEWRLLPAFDHPEEPGRCVVSGTGLTHLGSAANRNAMHGRSEEAVSYTHLDVYKRQVLRGRRVAGGSFAGGVCGGLNGCPVDVFGQDVRGCRLRFFL